MNAVQYVKNVGKSFGYAAIDVFKDNNPVIASMLSNTKDTTKDLYQSIKDFKYTVSEKASGAEKSLIGTGKDIAKEAWANAKSDLMSGKLYNKQRIEEVSAQVMGFDFDFNFDDDFGDFDFDDNETPTDSQREIEAEAKSAQMITAAVDTAAAKSVGAMATTTVKSTEYVVAAMERSTRALYDITGRGFNTINTGLASISTNMQNIVSLAEPLTTHMQNSATFFTSTAEFQKKTLEMLGKIVENTTPASQKQKSSNKKSGFTIDDLMSGGAIDPKAYYEMIVGNVKTYTDIFTSMFGMVGGAKGAGRMTVAASPLSYAVTKAVSAAVPEIKKEFMKTFNNTLENMMYTFLGGLKDKDFGNGIFGLLKDIFVPQSKFSSDRLMPGKFEKGKVDWDGVSRHALTYVIPHQLSQIISLLSGNEAKFFDYRTGRFKPQSLIKREFMQHKKQYSNSANSDFRYDTKAVVNKLNISQSQKDAINQQVEDFLYNATISGNSDFTEIFRGNYKPEYKSTYGIDQGTFSVMKKMMYGGNNNRDRLKRQDRRYSMSAGVYRGRERLGEEMSRLNSSGESAFFHVFEEMQDKKGEERINTFLGTDRDGNGVLFYLRGIYERLGGAGGKGGKRNRGRNRSISSAASTTQQYEDVNNISDAEIELSMVQAATDMASRVTFTDSAVQNYYDKKQAFQGSDTEWKNSDDYDPDMERKVTTQLKTKKFFGKVKDKLENTGVGKALNKMIDGISNLFANVSNGIESFFSNFGEEMHNFFENPKGYMGQLFGRIRDSIWNSEGMVKFRENVKNNLKAAANWVAKPVKDVYGSFKNIRSGEYQGGAANGRYITNTGVIAVSEGEMIVPAELNPYYHGTVNKRDQYRREHEAARRFLGYYGDGTDDIITDQNVGSLKRTKGKNGRWYHSFNGKRISAQTYNELKKKVSQFKRGKRQEIAQGILDNENASSADKIAAQASMAVDKAKDKASEWIDMLFPTNIKEEKEKMSNKIKEAIKSFNPDTAGGMGAGAAVGVGVSLLTGGLVGPILGAGLGAAAGLVVKSEKVQNILFGKLDDNGDREGGMLSKEISNFLTKNVPSIGRGGAIGAVGGLFLGSPVLGAILGSTVGYVSSSDKAKEYLFGKMGEDGEFKEGLLPKEFIDRVKKSFPAMAAGAALGFLFNPIPGVGMLGGALLGAAGGLFSTSNTFHKLMFGDPEKKNDKGLAGIFKERVLDNLDRTFHNLFNSISVWGKTLVQSTTNFVKNSLDKLMTKARNGEGGFLTRLVGGTLNAGVGAVKGAAKIVTAPLGAISRATSKYNVKHGYAVYNTKEGRNMSAQEMLDYANAYGYKTGYESLYTGLAGMDAQQLATMQTDMEAIKSGQASKEILAKYDKLGVDLTKLGDYNKVSALLKNEKKIKEDPEKATETFRNRLMNVLKDIRNTLMGIDDEEASIIDEKYENTEYDATGQPLGTRAKFRRRFKGTGKAQNAVANAGERANEQIEKVDEPNPGDTRLNGSTEEVYVSGQGWVDSQAYNEERQANRAIADNLGHLGSIATGIGGLFGLGKGGGEDDDKEKKKTLADMIFGDDENGGFWNTAKKIFKGGIIATALAKIASNTAGIGALAGSLLDLQVLIGQFKAPIDAISGKWDNFWNKMSGFFGHEGAATKEKSEYDSVVTPEGEEIIDQVAKDENGDIIFGPDGHPMIYDENGNLVESDAIYYEGVSPGWTLSGKMKYDLVRQGLTGNRTMMETLFDLYHGATHIKPAIGNFIRNRADGGGKISKWLLNGWDNPRTFIGKAGKRLSQAEEFVLGRPLRAIGDRVYNLKEGIKSAESLEDVGTLVRNQTTEDLTRLQDFFGGANADILARNADDTIDATMAGVTKGVNKNGVEYFKDATGKFISKEAYEQALENAGKGVSKNADDMLEAGFKTAKEAKRLKGIDKIKNLFIEALERVKEWFFKKLGGATEDYEKIVYGTLCKNGDEFVEKATNDLTEKVAKQSDDFIGVVSAGADTARAKAVKAVPWLTIIFAAIDFSTGSQEAEIISGINLDDYEDVSTSAGYFSNSIKLVCAISKTIVGLLNDILGGLGSKISKGISVLGQIIGSIAQFAPDQFFFNILWALIGSEITTKNRGYTWLKEQQEKWDKKAEELSGGKYKSWEEYAGEEKNQRAATFLQRNGTGIKINDKAKKVEEDYKAGKITEEEKKQLLAQIEQEASIADNSGLGNGKVFGFYNANNAELNRARTDWTKSDKTESEVIAKQISDMWKDNPYNIIGNPLSTISMAKDMIIAAGSDALNGGIRYNKDRWAEQYAHEMENKYDVSMNAHYGSTRGADNASTALMAMEAYKNVQELKGLNGAGENAFSEYSDDLDAAKADRGGPHNFGTTDIKIQALPCYKPPTDKDRLIEDVEAELDNVWAWHDPIKKRDSLKLCKRYINNFGDWSAKRIAQWCAKEYTRRYQLDMDMNSDADDASILNKQLFLEQSKNNTSSDTVTEVSAASSTAPYDNRGTEDYYGEYTKEEWEALYGDGGNSGLLRRYRSGLGGGSFISQRDPRYANMGIGSTTVGNMGCGPAAAVMALNQYSNNMKGAVGLANKYQTNGGTDAAFFGDYYARNGAKAKYYDGSSAAGQANIYNNIASGKPTVLMGRDDSNRSKSYSPFGPHNHYVVASGFDGSGNVIINDPELRGTKKYPRRILNNAMIGIGAAGNVEGTDVTGVGTIKKDESYLRKSRELAARTGNIVTPNGIIPKAPNSSSILSGNFTGIAASPTAQSIWAFLKQQGFSDAGAAGLMGCWQAESTNRPDRVEGDYVGSFPGFSTVADDPAAMDAWAQWLFGNYAKNGLKINQGAYLGPDGHYYPGFGLAQWTGGRGYNLLNWCKTHGYDWKGLDPQLKFAMEEFNSKYSGVYTILKSAEDVQTATTEAYHKYEGGKRSDWLQERIGYAKEFYEQYTGKEMKYDPNAVASGAIGGAIGGSVSYGSANTSSKNTEKLGIWGTIKKAFSSIGEVLNGTYNKDQDSLNTENSEENQYFGSIAASTGSVARNGTAAKGGVANNFPYFNQGEEPWGSHPYGSSGTIKTSGCGPTSMAMVMKSYGADVSPIETADWSVNNGYRIVGQGTGWGYFNAIGSQEGLTTEQFSDSGTAVNNLLNNIPVIASMRPGDFTKNGHYIVLSGINSDGSEVTVNDPSSRERTGKIWNTQHALGQAKQFWAISKNGKGSLGSFGLNASDKGIIGSSSLSASQFTDSSLDAARKRAGVSSSPQYDDRGFALTGGNSGLTLLNGANIPTTLGPTKPNMFEEMGINIPSTVTSTSQNLFDYVPYQLDPITGQFLPVVNAVGTGSLTDKGYGSVYDFNSTRKTSGSKVSDSLMNFYYQNNMKNKSEAALRAERERAAREGKIVTPEGIFASAQERENYIRKSREMAARTGHIVTPDGIFTPTEFNNITPITGSTKASTGGAVGSGGVGTGVGGTAGGVAGGAIDSSVLTSLIGLVQSIVVNTSVNKEIYNVLLNIAQASGIKNAEMDVMKGAVADLYNQADTSAEDSLKDLTAILNQMLTA